MDTHSSPVTVVSDEPLPELSEPSELPLLPEPDEEESDSVQSLSSQYLYE